MPEPHGVALLVSPTMCGGTRNQRQQSSAWNSLVSKNCASLCETAMACQVRPSSSTATRCWLGPECDASHSLLSRLTASSDNFLGEDSTPPGSLFFPNSRAPDCSAPMPRPNDF